MGRYFRRRRVGDGEAAAVFLLIFVFTFAPLAPLFAQETPTEPTEPPSDELTGEIDPVVVPESNDVPQYEPEPQAPTPDVPTEEIPTPDPTPEIAEPPQPGDSPEEIPEITEPIEETPEEEKIPEEEVPPEPEMLMMGEEAVAGGMGPISKQQKVSNFDGSFNFSYPIHVPPGRNGFQPDLALSYNSGQQSDQDIFGYGWSVNIPYIQRINKRGTEHYYSATSSTYYSSLSGELVQVGSTSEYRAKVETGDFLTYELDSNAWVVRDKQGTAYSFGTSAASRQDNASSSAQVYKWMVDEVRDTNDNYIEYSYYKNSNQIYPETISYTGHGSTDGDFVIEFLRESRSDNTVSYEPLFPIISNYRIEEITIEFDNSWVRKYELAYGTGDNGLRSILANITESGPDGITSVSLAPNALQCVDTSGDGWEDDGWELPSPFSSDYKDTGTRAVDINGDGLTDIIRFFSKDGTVQELYMNNGVDGWEEDTEWDWSDVWKPFAIYSSFGSTNPHNDLGTRFADVNGDGRIDVIASHNAYEVHDDVREVYINGGDGWYLDESWEFPAYITYYEDSRVKDAGIRIGDINGDRLPDVVEAGSPYQSPSVSSSVYINTGTTWERDFSWEAPEGFVHCDPGCDGYPIERGVQLIDVNGDGLDDFIRADDASSTNKVYLNNGSGWVLDTNWALPDYFTNSTDGSDFGYRFGNVNGDDLIDIVRMYYNGTTAFNKTFINTGEGWAEIGETPIGEVFSHYTYGDVGSRLFDVDGDGLSDIVYANGDANPLGGEPTSQSLFINQRGFGDSVEEITLPKGGTIDVTYKGSSEYQDGGDLLNPNLPYTLQTVASIVFDSGLGDSWTEDYEYTGGNIYFASTTLRDRKFAGFNTIIRTTPHGKERSYFHQGDTTSTSTGEYADDFSKIGFKYRTDIEDTGEDDYFISITKWENDDIGDNADFVRNTQAVELNYDGDSDHKDRAETYAYSTTTGNLTQKIEWGEVTGSLDGTFSDTGSDKFTTAFSYAASSTLPLFQLLSQVTVTNQASTTVQESKNYYDEESFGDLLAGNLTKQEFWVASSTYIDIEKEYNEFGLVTSEKDPRDKVTTYAYDEFDLYPETVTNALSQESEYTYDYAIGKVATKIDENGREFETVYDGLGRVIEEKVPNLSSPGSTVIKNAYDYTDDSVPTRIKTERRLDSGNESENYKYFDGFGRLVQERQETEEPGDFAVSDFIYEDGRLQRESRPYFESGTAYEEATAFEDIYTFYSYDVLGRKTSILDGRGTTTSEYDQWNTETTDAEGNVKEYVRDGYNNLAQVLEHTASSTYTTAYEFDYGHNLTKITDALGNVRNITYDGLGRRLSLQDLHDTGDGTFGTWYFAYDNSGNIASTTDPKSQNIQYTYDDINRVLTEDYTGAGGTETMYGYDSCDEGIGRLCVATSTSAVTHYNYNAVGGITDETKVIDGTSYQTQYEYDRQGNIEEITYPDNSQVRYTYNDAGQLETIEKKEDGEFTWDDVIDDFSYSPSGKISEQIHENGVVSEYTYDNFSRLIGKTTYNDTGTSTAVFQNLLYEYDNVDNIISIEETASTTAGRFVEYSYDELNRLTQVTGSSTVASTTATYKIPITIQHEKVGEELTDFPVYVDLSDLPSSFWNRTQSDGGDIKIRKNDLTTQVPMELVSINKSNQSGELYFKAPTLNTSGDTVFYIEYGGLTSTQPAATSTYGSQNVWNTSYQAVYHLGEAVNTTSNGYRDSTANSRHGTGSGLSTTAPNGKIGKGQDLDGTDDYITIPYQSLTTKPFTVSAWVRPDSLESNERYIVSFEGGTYRPLSALATDGSNSKGEFWYRWYGSTGERRLYSSTTVSTGVFSYFVGTNAGSSQKFYLNASLVGSATDASGSYAGTDNALIGAIQGPEQFWNGIVDEVRVLNTSLSAGWISTEYENQSNPDAFYEIGSEGEIVAIPDTYRVPLTVQESQISSTLTDFPVFVNLANLPGGFWSHVKSDGGDIRVKTSNGTTSVPVELVAIDTTGQTGELYFKPTTLSSATNTLFYIEYGDSTATQPSATSTYGSRAVWNSNYQAVYHLGETVNTTSNGYKDSTSNARHGTGSGLGTTAPTAKLGKGQDMDGTNDYITIPYASLMNKPFTISAWARPDSLATNERYVVSFEGGTYRPLSALAVDGANDKPEFWYRWNGSSGAQMLYASTTATENTFSYLVGTNAGTSQKFYMDSVVVASAAASTGAYSGADNALIGAIQGPEQFWNGVIDEVRILSVALSPEWISSEYINQHTPTTFYSVGSEEVFEGVEGGEEGGMGGSEFEITYTYDALGNILSSTDQGSYTYAETGYANPHAVTSVASTTYAYDNNGNVTEIGTAIDNTWDYGNRLAQWTNGTSTFAYGYDYMGERVRKAGAGATTTYPTKYYDVASTTENKYIYAGDILIATVENTASSSEIYHTHTDHLGGTNVTTDEAGEIEQVLDYNPFGSVRVEDGGIDLDTSHKFTGHLYDDESDFSYMGARYYSGDVGRFISQDPAFLGVGAPALEVKTGGTLEQYLSDPQNLNSYSYVKNNPLRAIDPTGEYLRDATTGYVGLKGSGLGMLEDSGGIIRANVKLILNNATINSYTNKDLIQSIIFEEQSHGPLDILTDSLIPVGKTAGLGQITINDIRSELGYNNLTREELMDPDTNIKEINNRIISITNQLNEKGIFSDNKDFIAYIASAYNSQENLGLISNYGRRVNAYHQDFKSKGSAFPGKAKRLERRGRK